MLFSLIIIIIIIIIQQTSFIHSQCVVDSTMRSGTSVNRPAAGNSSDLPLVWLQSPLQRFRRITQNNNCSAFEVLTKTRYINPLLLLLLLLLLLQCLDLYNSPQAVGHLSLHFCILLLIGTYATVQSRLQTKLNFRDPPHLLEQFMPWWSSECSQNGII